jgi:hypothetical protein
MFDKVDDIIYEPVRTICEGFRQPLKQLDAATERRKMELNHKLEMEMQQMGVDLDIDRKKRSVEIVQMEKDMEFARQKETLEVIKEYQENMGNTAVEIGNAIGTMSIELQAKAQDLITEKTKLFRDQEIEALHDATQGIREITEMFPEDRELRESAIKPYTDMMTNVVKETNAFIIDMKESMKALSNNINVITENVIASADNYLKPLCGNQLLSQENQSNSAGVIDNKTAGYIEN